MRSAENVVNEIKHWIKNLNTNKFVFRDPVFSINRKFTVELCNLIIENNLKIQFLIETHLKNLDDELIDLLKRAGLEMVYIGIESSDAKVLNGIKRFTVNNDEQYLKIKQLVEKKIIVKSMYMFGNPDDDINSIKTKIAHNSSLVEEENKAKIYMDENMSKDAREYLNENEDIFKQIPSIKTTIKYSKYLPNQLVQYSVFTPYPGTPIYKTFENKITEKKYEHFNQYNLVYKHNTLSNNNLIELKNLGYRSFYFNLGKIFIIFKSLFSLVRS